MCPTCWRRMTLCDACTRNAARYPEPSPFTLTCGTDTGYTGQLQPGRYNVVLMPPTGQLMLSTGELGDDGGCGRYVTLST